MRHVVRTLSTIVLILGLVALVAVGPAIACDGDTKSDSQNSSAGK